ncbi:MAG: cytochrome c biogenesis protein CcdA [Blautia producta]
MGFSFDVSVSALTVFFQGLLSFFSPCVLPLIPIYIGYLSGGTGKIGEDGKIHFKRSKVMVHTLCFVLGVSFAFFLLGLGFSAVGTFLKDNQIWFARIGGVLVIVFGLYQLGFLGKSYFLGKERRLPFRLDLLAMSPVTALIMGFTFSFAWTPCVGPALASVLLMAASVSTKVVAFGLIGVYTVGFVLPFLAVGLFTTTLLEFFKNHMKVVQYTVKIGGILMIFMGVLMLTGKLSVASASLSGTGQEGNVAEQAEEESAEDAEETDHTDGSEGEKLTPAVDFNLTDQYGNTHTLSQYKGKTIFLNFWGTWCPPCRAEMPDIQKLYEEFDQEGEDALVILGVAAPNLGKEKSEDGIKTFLEENGYTYPVLMDTEAELFQTYGITSFPTTIMIDRDGNLFGYATGQLNEETMRSIIQQTMEGKRE